MNRSFPVARELTNLMIKQTYFDHLDAMASFLLSLQGGGNSHSNLSPLVFFFFLVFEVAVNEDNRTDAAKENICCTLCPPLSSKGARNASESGFVRSFPEV